MEAPKVSPPHFCRRVKSLATALALAGVLACVPAAHAQEPGVVYEPGSPSEKEYAIPLEEARNEAGGDRPGSEEALAFGIGLSRKGGGGAGDGSNGDRGLNRRSGDKAEGSGGRDAEAQGARSAGLAQRLADAEDAAAPALWRLGPLLLVLLPALLVGLVLARRESERPAAT